MEGIIILGENLKLIGMIKNNNNKSIYIPINIIINKINYIKCIYEIKKEDIGKEIQIINDRDDFGKNKNEEIEEKIKVIINGEILKILKYQFYEEGLYTIYIVTEKLLTDMYCMFSGCSGLKELNLSSFKTDQVNNMSSIFRGCSGLKELDLSSIKTDQVTNMLDDTIPGSCKIKCKDKIFKKSNCIIF